VSTAQRLVLAAKGQAVALRNVLEAAYYGDSPGVVDDVLRHALEMALDLERGLGLAERMCSAQGEKP